MKRYSAAELLETIPDSGLPGDYLYSRLKGRKAHLVPDWNEFLASRSPIEHLPVGHYQRILGDRTTESLWRALLLEYGWVYRQMNQRLREVFAPFFLYADLKTIFICLRFIQGLKKDKVKQMLMPSILSDDIKKLLIQSDDIFSAVQGIEKTFLCFSKNFSGLLETMRAEGLRGVEQGMLECFLFSVVRSETDPLLKAFFRRLIDARNVLALVKLIRHGQASGHRYISGGTIAAARFDDITAGRKMEAADTLLRKLTGEPIGSHESRRIEASLYRSISRWLRRQRRTGSGKSTALDYLWRCSIDALNLGLLAYGRNLAPDAAAAELVR